MDNALQRAETFECIINSDNDQHPAKPTKKDQLKQYLNHKVHITVTDERVFIGFFVCIDRNCNLVLNAANEQDNGVLRFVGTVIIKGEDIVKAQVEDIL
ncbi:hypothetical protein BDV3_001896 [Batrachochytrium dendrobatidis]